MQYFKNIEIAEMYKVSPNTVGNWIEAAKDKKINLELFQEGNRVYITKSANNHFLLEYLSKKGKKFKNRISLKTIYPTDEFYKIFNSERYISEIVTSLEKDREIQQKYTYLDEGAEQWEKYVLKSVQDKYSNTVTNTNFILKMDQEYINSLIESAGKINIIDLGVGDGTPLKYFTEGLFNKNLLNKYYGVDFSEQMLNIAENNFKKWFGENFPFIRVNKDFVTDSLQEILFFGSASKDENTKIINLIFYVGGTIENQLENIKTIANIKRSMGKDDILLLGVSLSPNKMHNHTNILSYNEEKSSKTPGKERWLLEKLGITEDLYELTFNYNRIKNSRYMKIVFKNDLDIIFDHDNYKRIITFHKGESVTLWRHKHHSLKEITTEIFDNGLDIIHATTSLDREHLMVIAKTKIV